MLWVVPFTQPELSHWETVIPTGGVIVRCKYFLFMLLRLDVLLPLFLTVAVLPTKPAMVTHLATRKTREYSPMPLLGCTDNCSKNGWGILYC